MACIKLKKLEQYLEDVENFKNPKIKLEQYMTPDHIASCMLYTIQTNFNDIENRIVADLGSGSGMLSIGSYLLGAAFTIGFEIDRDAIDTFVENVDDIATIDCVQCDILNDFAAGEQQDDDDGSGARDPSKWYNFFDTVIMNPPFGTKKNAGIDMQFLQIGLRLSRGSVYSLHKTSTRDHITKKAAEWNVQAKVVAELKYNIESSYKFHKKNSVDIEVDFWRFEKK